MREQIETNQPKRKKKLTYSNYIKLLILACLVILAFFLAPWIWLIVVVWLFFWFTKRGKKKSS